MNFCPFPICLLLVLTFSLTEGSDWSRIAGPSPGTIPHPMTGPVEWRPDLGAALVNTLDRVLRHHYDPRSPDWDIDGAIPDPVGPPETPDSLPAYAAFSLERPHFARQECIHCHQIADLENFGDLEAGTFDEAAFRQPWPFPENVGIELDRDDGLRVNRVDPESPAGMAGIASGDSLFMASGRRLFGQADFRGVLHRAPLGDAVIEVGWLREGRYREGRLDLRDGLESHRNLVAQVDLRRGLRGMDRLFPLERAAPGERLHCLVPRRCCLRDQSSCASPASPRGHPMSSKAVLKARLNAFTSPL